MGRKLYQNDMIHIRKASFRKKMQLQRTDACHLGIRPERLENPKAIHYDYCALGTHTHAFHVEILRATATVCFPTNATMHGIFEALDHMGKQQKKARGQGSQVKWLEADNRIEWNIQVNFAFVVGHCLNLSDPKNQYTHTHTTQAFSDVLCNQSQWVRRLGGALRTENRPPQCGDVEQRIETWKMKTQQRISKPKLPLWLNMKLIDSENFPLKDKIWSRAEPANTCKMKLNVTQMWCSLLLCGAHYK